MANLVWICTWIAMAIWSLMCWAAFGLIDVASGLAVGSSSLITSLVPGAETLVSGLIGLADDIGEAILFVVWLGVSGTMLGAAWLFGQFFRGSPSRPPPDWTDTRGALTAPTIDAAEFTSNRRPDALDRLAKRGIQNSAMPRPRSHEGTRT